MLARTTGKPLAVLVDGALGEGVVSGEHVVDRAVAHLGLEENLEGLAASKRAAKEAVVMGRGRH